MVQSLLQTDPRSWLACQELLREVRRAGRTGDLPPIRICTATDAVVKPLVQRTPFELHEGVPLAQVAMVGVNKATTREQLKLRHAQRPDVCGLRGPPVVSGVRLRGLVPRVTRDLQVLGARETEVCDHKAWEVVGREVCRGRPPVQEDVVRLQVIVADPHRGVEVVDASHGRGHDVGEKPVRDREVLRVAVLQTAEEIPSLAELRHNGNPRLREQLDDLDDVGV
mmetsp:Transcript_14411/g.39359  ORF Transcript_14411/g.39359 Transcript_14411/m.39359 type:complete len:224 (-) Transcript_14411:823-1494(-)